VNDDICERGVPGAALNTSSTSYPDHGRYGDLPLQGKIATAESIIEPGTSWLVFRSSDHKPRGWSVLLKIEVLILISMAYFDKYGVFSGMKHLK
jgi:hypothetical protein